MLAYRDAPGWQYLSPAAQDEAAAAAREASWLAESAAELAAAQARARCLAVISGYDVPGPPWQLALPVMLHVVTHYSGLRLYRPDWLAAAVHEHWHPKVWHLYAGPDHVYLALMVRCGALMTELCQQGADSAMSIRAASAAEAAHS